ncbi:hypothetical protein [Oryza sativa Japonica Group]|uniref:Uncharacterized protein n=1 Tax=Oryza sativa subsp. japonica TaxID=39947 RepID=Q5VQN1_ORYSJ|nr:hypothetical protein [Oryza sativa Japonica Group]BAD68243.1 hypothetical protein [Oryza sativa Japonica Group]
MAVATGGGDTEGGGDGGFLLDLVGGYDAYEDRGAACENQLFSQAYAYRRAFPRLRK